MTHDTQASIEQSLHTKPQLCLTIGVTGHRDHRLAGVDLTAVSASVATTLQQLQTAMNAVKADHPTAFSHKPAELRMVSALADGADTIVAHAALDNGWRVDACLPFPRDVYAHDFQAGAPHDEFVALLGRTTHTFELNGEHLDPESRNASYEAVGRLMLEQSDILLAIWDGDPGRGRGGTSRVVAEAVARHIPVIHVHVHTQAGQPVQLMWTGLSDAEIEQPSVEIVPRADAAIAVGQVVAALTVPPDNKIDGRMLTQFYRARAGQQTAALPYPLLLAATGVRRLSRRDLAPTSAEESAATLSALVSDAADKALLESPLIPRYGVADSAAAYFAQIFRSGFVTNFSFAAVAVMLALSGPLAPAFKLPLISVELVIVILILVNTHAGVRFGWHERWMDNRHLAEQLRALSLTSLVGDLGLRDHIAPSMRDAAAIPGWVGWLARATAREVGLPNAVADTEYLTRVSRAAERLIDDQIAYQQTNAARMHKLEHRLHRAGEVLFIGTIFACVAWIIAKLSGMPLGAPGTIGATEIVTALTASMPALGASIYGIRMQGDFAGVAYRAQVTVTRLTRLRRAMANDVANNPVDYTRLTARLRNLADIMLTDVANWRTTYQARPLALPG